MPSAYQSPGCSNQCYGSYQSNPPEKDFMLHSLRTQVCRLQVQARYYPLVKKLLLEVTGGSRVHIFDHMLRQGKIT